MAHRHTFRELLGEPPTSARAEFAGGPNVEGAENGVRGFVITGEEQFLQPNLAVRGTLGSGLVALRALSKCPKLRSALPRLRQ